MAITGAVAAAVRKFDAYPRFGLALDFAGRRTGRPFYKLGGRTFGRAREVPGFSYTRSGADFVVYDRATNTIRGRFAADVMPLVPGYGLDTADAATNLWTGHAFPTSSVQALAQCTSLNSSTRAWVARADLPEPVLAALNRLDPTGLVAGVLEITAAGGEIPGANFLHTLPSAGDYGLSVFAYVTEGVWSMSTSSNVGVGQGFTATANGQFTRVENVVNYAASGNSRFRAAGNLPAGAKAYVFGFQVEAGTVTPLVPTAGAQASRGSAILRIDALDWLFVRPFTMVARAKGRPADGISRCLMQVDNGSNSGAERIQLTRSTANDITLANGAGSNVSVGGMGWVGAFDLKAAAQYRHDGIDLNTDGLIKTSNGTATTTLADRNSLTIGASRAGTTSWRGPIEFVGVIARPTTQVEREALAA